jgi:hypothetical protein
MGLTGGGRALNAHAAYGSVEMRILVWNMNQRARAWQWFEQRRDVDVALLQETAEPPAWTRDAFLSCVWRPKYASAGSTRSYWGSAILARSLELEPFEPDTQYPWLAELVGSTAIARTAGEPTWLVSAHLSATQISEAVLECIPIADIEPTALRKRADGYTVWEANVIPHELHRLFANDTFLWGGDLNTDPRMDDYSGFAGGNRRMFDIYREAWSHTTYAPASIATISRRSSARASASDGSLITCSRTLRPRPMRPLGMSTPHPPSATRPAVITRRSSWISLSEHRRRVASPAPSDNPP